MKCASYVNGVLEKEHVSKREAAKYLKSIGYDKASDKAIDRSLSGDRKSAYKRTWKRIWLHFSDIVGRDPHTF